jgi:hypothetical protein
MPGRRTDTDGRDFRVAAASGKTKPSNRTPGALANASSDRIAARAARRV